MKSTTFRIIPVRPDLFHVEEKRRFWFGWKKCGRLLCSCGDCVFDPNDFKTQEDAQQWIADEIRRRIAEAKHMATPATYVHVGT